MLAKSTNARIGHEVGLSQIQVLAEYFYMVNARVVEWYTQET